MRRALRGVAIGAAALIAALVGYEAFALWRAEQRTPAVLARAEAGTLRLSDLGQKRVDMLLRVEDPNFIHHHGVDLSTPGAGLTTITQSLVKQNYFDHFQPGFAKIEQSLIARFIVDGRMAKALQLRAFINTTPFGTIGGRPVIGFADAAQAYYGRSLGQLDDRQFLSLVAMLLAPKELDPLRHKAANDERVRRIEAILHGKCRPLDHRDVTYEGCARV